MPFATDEEIKIAHDILLKGKKQFDISRVNIIKEDRSCYVQASPGSGKTVDRIVVGNRRRTATGRVGRIRRKSHGEGSVAICRDSCSGRQSRTALIREADRSRAVDIHQRQGFGLTCCRNAQTIVRNGDVVTERLLRIGECGRYRLTAVERVRVINRRCSAAGG